MIMKLQRILLTATIATLSAIAVQAQADQSSATLTRAKRDRNQPEATTPRPGDVTQRMQSFYENNPGSDADLQWMRVIYRSLDLQKPQNAPLYFPEEPSEGNDNLFRIIMTRVADGQLPAYEYLDGRELFTDRYLLNVPEMLDRFHIPYTQAKGSTAKSVRYTIADEDLPSYEVLSYYIIERWTFDTRTNKTRVTVEAICPVVHRSGDLGLESVKYPMFWVKLDPLRPYLAAQDIFVSDDNNLARYTFDDFFAMNMYDGEIYKTRNLANKSLMQLFPDPDDLRRAQDSIQARLESHDRNLWVPTREELEAIQADGKTTEVDKTPKKEKEVPRRSARTPKVKKQDTPKQSSSNNSGGAVRSVRRRR